MKIRSYLKTMAVLAAVFMILSACSGGKNETPMHVEEFQIAEPLRTGHETALQDQMETITAVTKPYDAVEASVEEEPEKLASTNRELHAQCLTVLREIAFCTSEDSYLETIAESPALQSNEERKEFLKQVEYWFEPGGTEATCEELLSDEELTENDAKKMWHAASEATSELCDVFGKELLDASAFEWLEL